MQENLKQELTKLLIATASTDKDVAANAMKQFLALAEEPFRNGIFDGPVLFDKVFTKIDASGDSSPKFPLHFALEDDTDDYMAYVVPYCGAIPQRAVVGDDVKVDTYRIANSIDACLNYIRKARWDVVQGMMEAYQAGFTNKLNVDAGRVLLTAAKARTYKGNPLLVDNTAAAAGTFTFKLVSDMINSMKRAGGGNSTSVNGYRLTDMLISPEAMGDLRNVNLELFTIRRGEVAQDEGMVLNLFGVNFHELYELGVGESLLTYFTGVLSGTLAASNDELVIGLDLTKKRNFVMPVSKELETTEDPMLHRMGKWGVYGDMEVGFGVLDARAVILGQF